jgi:3-deoxy-D-manno-octulosonic-acid transferase
MKRLFFVYQLVIHLLGLPVLLLWPLLALKLKRIRPFWWERLGLWEKVPQGAVWIHGASMGEIRSVAPLVGALRKKNSKVLLTAMSDTGRTEAGKMVDGFGAARMIPLDFFWTLLPAFLRARPSAIVVAETEIWPGFLLMAHFFNIPMILVSGRISDKTFNSYRKMRSVVGPLLNLYGEIHAQSDLDAERFRQLGARAEIVRSGGNMKFDVEPADPSSPEALALREAREAGFEILVAGSTHPGEERAIIKGMDILKKKGVKAGVVIAPRHLGRLGEVLSDITGAGCEYVRWSELGSGRGLKVREAFESGKVLVIDAMGVLAKLYSGADVAFVGGTIAPVGGHSLLEPLSAGIPVLFGPNVRNTLEVAREAKSLGVGFEVKDGYELADKIIEILNDPESKEKTMETSGAFLSKNRGSVDRVLKFLDSGKSR